MIDPLLGLDIRSFAGYDRCTMGRWKRCVRAAVWMAAIWMAALIVPAGIARASTTGLIAFTSDRDHPFMGLDLYTMAADGTGVARLTTDATPSAYYSSPDWSYDGTKIAVIKNARVWVMNANGSNPTELTTAAGADFHPSWSPDGTKIAYEHRTPTPSFSQIVVMNADGSNPQTLASNPPYDDTTPSWSPDGTKIAFVSDRVSPFIPQIYVMGADGSNQTPVTTSSAPSGDSAPAWSPDGTKIAFVGDVVSGGTHSPHIFVMNANGTNPVQITNGGGSGEGSPTWSLDGTQIAFAASYPPMPNTFAPSQMYKVKSDGTGTVTDLSNNSYQEGSPAWQKTAVVTAVVDISAGNPVPEPATGSTPATFTITMPAAQASDVTVHYKTLDGTAKAAANAYTPIADASVTIPAGQTSAQIQVQVDNGSGQASTQTESFQVQLTGSSGPPIATATATGVILIPGITGKITDETGAAQPGQGVALTGTAASGQAVTQHLVTDGGGRYQLYADPGTYTITPDPSASQQPYQAVGCPGTAKPGACTQIALNPGANLTADFTLLSGVTISAGNPVPEPATGSTPATFTITMPAAQVSDVTVHYKTLDGTAKAADNAYTPIADASVTIPAGQTSAQIQVQVDNGSGKASTPTETFQVQLTSSSGPPIAGGTATGVILIPGISGKITDQNGNGQPGHLVALTGTAVSGQMVTQHVFTDTSGTYHVYADPGTYTITPDPPSGKPGNPSYQPIGCPGTVKTGACTKIALGSGASLTIDFKLLLLVVNSRMDSEDLAQAGLGICDVTPAQAAQTCTLRQALDVANQLGGGTITFNIPGGGVPVIPDSGPCLCVYAPTVIDGTTQPGSHGVTVMGVGSVVGFTFGTSGSTLRGMTVSGFYNHDVGLYAGDTLEQDRLGTLPSTEKPTVGIVQALNTGGHNVIQGNTIGGPQVIAGSGVLLMDLEGAGDTIGGSLPGQGNTFTNGGAQVNGAGDVVQGNTFVGAVLEIGDNVTVGGPTPIPGTGAGNDISGAEGAGLELHSSGDVVQGNRLHGNAAAGIEVVKGDRNTIGGASPQMGNLVDGNGIGSGGQLARAGIAIGEPFVLHQSSFGGTGNVIEHNRIVDNPGDGGVAIYQGVGNQIIDNEMSGNTLGINLGGGPFLYDNASHTGPNDYQPYPQLYGVTSHGGLHVTGRLNASPDRTYTIELYSQPSCAIDSVTPGQGLHYIGRRVLPAGSTFTLAFPAPPAGQHGVTVTATADDGSTSEFSPCLTIGHAARSFGKSGVTPTANTITVTTTTSPAPAPDRAATRESAKAKPTAHGILQLLCPPITTGSCTGTLVLATTGRGAIVLARKHFKLAPGEGLTITFAIPASLLKRLQRAHRLAAKATITAHDAAKHHNHKTTITTLTLRLAD